MADKTIDPRLLDADCVEKIEENFNRVLALIDSGGSSTGGGVYIVYLRNDQTWDPMDVDTYTFDGVTFTELKAIYDAGKTVLFSWYGSGLSEIFYEEEEGEGDFYTDIRGAALSDINKLRLTHVEIVLLSDDTYENSGTIGDYELTPAT